MKKAETASSQLKKIVTLQDQWEAAITSKKFLFLILIFYINYFKDLATITADLAESVQEFCKEVFIFIINKTYFFYHNLRECTWCCVIFIYDILFQDKNSCFFVLFSYFHVPFS